MTNTIGSPATDPSVIIGVAATTTFRSYAADTMRRLPALATAPGSTTTSRAQLRRHHPGRPVPDLAAPGRPRAGRSAPPTPPSTRSCPTTTDEPSPIQHFGGTSQSAPLTAGAAALVIEAYENTHHGVRPAPALVKRLLTSTATDLGLPASEQGAGLLNTLAAVQAAQSWHDGNGSPRRPALRWSSTRPS